MSKKVITSIRIDKELWKDAKIYAIRKGITVSALLEKLLKEEIKGSGEKKEAK